MILKAANKTGKFGKLIEWEKFCRFPSIFFSCIAGGASTMSAYFPATGPLAKSSN
jgi:hypothetical protein